MAHQTSNRVPAPGAEHSPLHADFMSIMQLHSTGGMLVRARACCPSICRNCCVSSHVLAALPTPTDVHSVVDVRLLQSPPTVLAWSVFVFAHMITSHPPQPDSTGSRSTLLAFGRTERARGQCHRARHLTHAVLFFFTVCGVRRRLRLVFDMVHVF